MIPLCVATLHQGWRRIRLLSLCTEYHSYRVSAVLCRIIKQTRERY